MLQFILEALIMSLLGGAIGLAGGALVAKLASLAAGVELTVTLPYVLLSLFVSSAVGILSGWYPAARAAKMDPVEALRSE
jgi:putative ABC transport system permease protein